MASRALRYPLPLRERVAALRVRQNGEIKWRGNMIYITAALIGEPICLTDDANGRHTVFFGPVVLGTINHGEDRLRKPRG
jgi:hypothetical protein